MHFVFMYSPLANQPNRTPRKRRASQLDLAITQIAFVVDPFSSNCNRGVVRSKIGKDLPDE